jgi:ribosomal protein L28
MESEREIKNISHSKNLTKRKIRATSHNDDLISPSISLRQKQTLSLYFVDSIFKPKNRL